MAGIFRLGGAEGEQTAYAMVNRGYYAHNKSVVFDITKCKTVLEAFINTMNAESYAGTVKSQVSNDNINWIDFTVHSEAGRGTTITNKISNLSATNNPLISDVSNYKYYKLISTQNQNQGVKALFCKFDNIAEIIAGGGS